MGCTIAASAAKAPPWVSLVQADRVVRCRGCRRDRVRVRRARSPATSTTTDAATASYAKAPCPNPIYPKFRNSIWGPTPNAATSRSRRIGPLRTAGRSGSSVATLKTTSPNPKPDPVVYLAGGPGGTPLVHRFGDWQLDRDLILLGERGTFKTIRSCPAPRYDQFLADAIGIGAEGPPTTRRAPPPWVLAETASPTKASTSPPTTPPRTPPTSPISGSRWASTSGTSTRCPTAPTSRCRVCGITRGHPVGGARFGAASSDQLTESGWAGAQAASPRSSMLAPPNRPARRAFPTCATNSSEW